MKHLLAPDAWRSEAFAEDLFDDARRRAAPQGPSPRPRVGPLASNLIGLAPLLLAVAGMLLVV